ncbi:MAG: DUF362 domain-containing protein [Deltaproteobacteria bacterium]
MRNGSSRAARRRGAAFLRGGRLGRVLRRRAPVRRELETPFDDAEHPLGYWRNDTRLEYHKDATTFHEKTAEGNTASTLLDKQRFVLTAADKILTTFGPDKGHVTEPKTGLVMASRSVVAHDMVSMAWFLVGQQETEPSEFIWFKDPYSSSFIVTMANRWVVSMLGGIPDAIAAEKLTRNDLKAVWDDRTLNRAYHAFGGRSRVQLKPANDQLPEELKQRLTAMITPPA